MGASTVATRSKLCNRKTQEKLKGKLDSATSIKVLSLIIRPYSENSEN